MFFVLYHHNGEFGLATKKDFSLEKAQEYMQGVHKDYNAFVASSDLTDNETGEFYIIYHHFGERVLIHNQSFTDKKAALDYAHNIEVNLEAFVVRKVSYV